MRMLLTLFLVLLSLPALANRKGVGISLGNPTGLNGKYWLDEKSAVDAGLALSIGKHSNLSLHSDYLLHNPGALIFNDVHPLDLYCGLGARMEFADDIEIGFRVPIGLAHTLDAESADLFAEVAPIFDVLTRNGIELHLLFGARYYF